MGIPTDDPSPFADEPSYEDLKNQVAALELLTEQQAADHEALRIEIERLTRKVTVSFPRSGGHRS